MLRLAYVLIAVVATGCTLHFGDDAPGDDCPRGDSAYDDGSDGALEAPLPDLLNPETLQCETFGYGCDSRCGPCDLEDPAPTPTWAYCGNGCEGLGEADCWNATQCRATYDYNCYTGDGPCEALVPFLGCYGTDQNGPIEGACSGLSAQECSRHNDCIALHTPQCSGNTAECWQQFVECRGENVTCWGPVTCTTPAPGCDDNSAAAIRDGCYTGDCIPLDQCEPICDGPGCG